MEERRKYPRFDLKHDVIYKSSSGKGKTVTDNVSRGGIKVKVEEAVDNGQNLDLSIFPFASKDPVDAVSTVVWNRKDMDDSWLMGLAFTKIGWTESDRLIEEK